MRPEHVSPSSSAPPAANHVLAPYRDLTALPAKRALPLDSSHSALNVHNALGLNQDKYPQVNFNRPAALVCASKVP
ncbi:hypothetical protein EYF80_001933 [Liparis tanakae]|uniref:Uncharacterized protein n=1 Tax=Liparis tanakae TaxID=230148 RepID=A0A4Z2JCM7_9TELE|nr:hypothetical protein EYF80_001933 [Liparis tanakae]